MNFFMLLKRQVKAGVLLYALLMTAILSLVLTFYTHRLKAAYQLQRAQALSSQSYVLAELAKPLAKESQGRLRFDKGEVAYHYQGNKLMMTVISGGRQFDYHFLTKKAPPTTKEEETKELASKVATSSSVD